MFYPLFASVPEGPGTQDPPAMESPRRVGFIFWMAWVAANAVGFGAGAASFWGDPLVNSAINVGLMHALVLRWRFSHRAIWALATTVGMAVGWSVAFILLPRVGFLARLAGTSWSLILIWAGTTGTAIGIMQGFILRGRAAQRVLWILANIVGYATGSVAGLYAGFAWGARYGFDSGLIVGFTVAGATTGLITGIALIRLVRLPQWPPAERSGLDMLGTMVRGLGLLRWPILSVSILAWIIAEGVILPLIHVEAPNAQAATLIVSGWVVLVAMAAFVVYTAAALVAPASVVGKGRLPELVLALVSVMLALGVPSRLMYLTLSCKAHWEYTGSICRSLGLLLPLTLIASPALIAFVYVVVRLALIPPAVALGGASVRKAFRLSWQLTQDRWGHLFLPSAAVVVLWPALPFVPPSWPMPWLSLAHGVLGGVASAWLAIVLALAYVQLGETTHPEQVGPARSVYKRVIAGILIFAVVGAGLAIGRRGLTPSGYGRIAFSSTRHSTTQIYMMNADGSNVVQLTSPPGEAWAPRFSPDGRRIVFQHDGTPPIRIMNADGSSAVRPSDLPRGSAELGFVLGGSKIAFVTCNKENLRFCEADGIYLMNPEGSEVTRLVGLPKKILNPDLSSDGRRIAFVSTENGQVYVMNTDGSNAIRLTNFRYPAFPNLAAYLATIADADKAVPTFSPDGTKIAFVSVNDRQLYTVNADGSNLTRLTDLRPAGTFCVRDPAFSPDGTRIAFACNGDIYVASADGSRIIRLTSIGGYKGYPTVSP